MDEKVSATVKCLLDADRCCFQGKNTPDIKLILLAFIALVSRYQFF